MRTAIASSDFDAWRSEARVLLHANVPPSQTLWTPPGATGSLFDLRAPAPDPGLSGAGARAAALADGSCATRAVAHVPKRFLDAARLAVLHRDPATHAVLYRVLWRVTHGEHDLLDDAADPDTRALAVACKQVRRDEHQMHAFVRFRTVGDDHVAWHAPDHHIVDLVAPFFRERFHGMRWTILTPDRSVGWDGQTLTFGPGAPRHAAPAGDELEALWRTYYAAIFNPARANPTVMRQHMPQRYWPAMPETQLIPELLAKAQPRVAQMIAPARTTSLEVLREEAARCTACELCGPATQMVFGEGPPDAPLVLIGEQPGDEEDRAGRPFIGPSGRLLDEALATAGIDRAATYVTNAVKHFRFLPRGKLRLHQRPTADQVRACKPWLGAELSAIKPRVIVCLGATASQSVIGSRFRVSQSRGERIATHWAEHLVATHHPAAILRAEPADSPRYLAEMIADLAKARALL